MIQSIQHLNWFAILAASVAHFLLGGVWFAALFARSYAHALGIVGGPQAKPGPLFLAGPFVCGAINIVTTAVLMKALGIDALGEALALGGLVGVGYLAAMTANIAINPLFPRPFLYTLVTAPMFVVGSLMSSAILVYLP